MNKCPNCKSNKIENIWNVYESFSLNWRSNIFNFYECLDCNIRFKWNYYSYHELNNYYSKIDVNTWKSEKLDKRTIKNFKQREKLLNKYSSWKRILDIWSFSCDFLNFLPKDRIKIWLEPSKIIFPKWIKKIESTLEKYDFKWERFDIICFFDVIEHILDINIFFDKIDEVLDTDWIIIFETGDFSSKLPKILWNEWSYYNIFWHCIFYDIESIDKYLIEKRWYEILNITNTNKYNFDFKWFIQIVIYKLFKIVVWALNLYKMSKFIRKYYYHVPPWFLYKDHMLIIAKKK